MSSIVVTGPRGLLGSTVVRVFRDAGFDVHPYEGDITNPEELRAFVESLSTVDVVVHTAAVTNVNQCEKEPVLCTSVNVDGTRNVRDAAASRNVKLIHISTVSVFDGVDGNYREDDPTHPINAYNTSKEQAERVVMEYENALILRINIIGIHPDGSRGRNFMEWLIDSFRNNADMNLFTDIRINPLSSWTLAERIKDLVMQWPTDKILHLGSRTILSKADIGRLIAPSFPSYSGKMTVGSSDAVSTQAYRPKNLFLNTDRAQVLGLEMPSLEDELKRIMNTLS